MVRIKANEFKLICKEFLAKQGIAALRPYGREIGVAEPTAKSKGALIEDIIAILAGELDPTPRSTRGAPIKDDFVDPNIKAQMNRICDRYPMVYMDNGADGSDIRAQLKELKENPRYLSVEDPNRSVWKKNLSTPLYKGQFARCEGQNKLFPLSFNGNEEEVYLSEQTVKKFGLREGDIVTCYPQREGDVLVVSSILTINETLIEYVKRGKFEEFSACYPNKKIRFCKDGEPLSVAEKCFEWLLPIGRGQRGLILSPPKAGKSKLLLEMAKSIERCNQEIKVLVLLIDQSPENVASFRNQIDKNDLVYTTFEDSAEAQVFAADFLLNRAKRLAEDGRDVCLLVDSFNALAHAYNHTELSIGGKVLAGGMESKTLQYLKRFFGSARALENSGSITILGALSTETGDPSDSLLKEDLSSVCNWQIRLHDNLAKKRIYPALDCSNMQGNIDGALSNDVANELEDLIRTKFIPKHGIEEVISLLVQCATVEELKKVLQNGAE